MKIIIFLLAIATLLVDARPKPPVIIQPLNPNSPVKWDSTRGPAPRVLIAGGGLAGLSSALELAERGFEVTIKEMASVLGGRLSTKLVKPLFNNDTVFPAIHGFHAWFYNYFQFDDILTRLNLHKNFREWKKVEYIFRNYKPESIYSEGPYPLNLLGILTRSPNMGVTTALGLTFALPDLAFYDYEKVYQKYDNLTLMDWVKLRRVDKKFFDIVIEPAAAVTLSYVFPFANVLINLTKSHSSERGTFSAAEILNLMSIFFMSDPRADSRRKKDFGTGVINPWINHLNDLGVTIKTESPVAGLKFQNGRAVGETTGEEYDYVILALDLPGQKIVLENSVASDLKSAQVLQKLRDPISRLKIAPPYKVMRVWFDGRLPDSYPDIIETPQHYPIHLVAQFNQIEDEAAMWANATHGSIMEFHLYCLKDAEWSSITDAQVWDKIKSTAYEIAPEIEKLKVLGYNVNSYHNFPSFEKGQHHFRPFTTFPSKVGATNVAFAGDFVQTAYPSFIMERAVSTGREAANFVLLDSGVRQVTLKVLAGKGPGLI